MPSTPTLATLPKEPNHFQQRPIARRRGGERLDAQDPSEGVHRCGYMNVEVGVHATGDRARGFYDGQRHPFSPLGQGVARPSREGVTVRIVLA